MPHDTRDTHGNKTPLASLLNLEEIGEDRFRTAKTGQTDGRIYGGQLLGQAVAAAQHCVADDRLPHSLHGYFMRPGDVDQHVELQVERVRDGRSLSQRSVRALQQGKELFRALLSFHVPEAGLEYDAPSMPEVPPPEEISFTYVDFIEAMSNGRRVSSQNLIRSMDIRYINPPDESRKPVYESQRVWMRAVEEIPAEWSGHYAALAFLSDSTLIDHVMLPHGRRWHDQDLEGASLDHSIWFHRPVRADEWLLYDQSPEWTGHARGLSRGSIFDQGGRLVATCIQEGLMRTS